MYQYRKILLLPFLLILITLCQSCKKDYAKIYVEKCNEIKVENAKIKKGYRLAPNKKEKNKWAKQADKHLFYSIQNDLFSQWYGTAWDFNGTTEIPNTGNIACGYFVTTVLRDAGFNVDRRTLAQQASEKIIKSLVKDEYINRYSNSEVENFVKDVIKKGDGLYIIGLDSHVGFLEVDNKNVDIIHSAKSSRKRVMRENALDSQVIKESNYRVIGRISNNKELLKNWLLDTRIKTATK